jgi:hypothetical protein
MGHFRVRALLLAALVGWVPSAAPQASFTVSEPFASMPAWADTWHAPWTYNTSPPSASVTWSVEPAGGAPDGSGNTGYLRGVRHVEGSSVQVLQVPVPQNANLYVGCWMRCPSNYDPSPGTNYWMEAGVVAGAPTNGGSVGRHFDDPATGGAWTVFKKFEHLQSGGLERGNNNAWTWYYTAAPLATGTNSVISLGFKLGNHYQPYAPPAPNFDVGYDGVTVSDQPLTTPPGGGTPPPPGGGGSTGGGGGRENDNGDGEIQDRCGCSTVGVFPPAWAWLFGALGLAAAARGRR